MCDGIKCSHCDQELHRREGIVKRIKELVMYLNRDMSQEEFTSVRLEIISLADSID